MKCTTTVTNKKSGKIFINISNQRTGLMEMLENKCKVFYNIFDRQIIEENLVEYKLADYDILHDIDYSLENRLH